MYTIKDSFQALYLVINMSLDLFIGVNHDFVLIKYLYILMSEVVSGPDPDHHFNTVM